MAEQQPLNLFISPELKRECGEPPVREFIDIAEKFMAENKDGFEPMAIAMGMALAGFELCHEHDYLRYRDYVDDLVGVLIDEANRTNDQMSLVPREYDSQNRR